MRGTRFNTGDGIRMALDIGAMPYGNWSGCHAVGWERNAPEFGDLAVGDQFQKHSYPFAIMVNATGRRFVDEGADFRNYTYAKYGRVILEQPGQFAWQIFDAKVAHLKRDEYNIRQITKATANTLEELAPQLDGVDAGCLPRRDRGLQRRRPHRHLLQPQRQGRALHARAGGSQVELGQHDRRAAVRGLCGDLRHHVYLRRAPHRHRRASAGYRVRADPRALRGGRTGWRDLLFQLSRAAAG